MSTFPRLGAWMQRHPVLAFVLLAYGCSWILWVPASYFSDGNPYRLLMLMMAGGWGPAIAAVVLARSGRVVAVAEAERSHRFALFASAAVLGLLVAVAAFASGGRRALTEGREAVQVSFSGVHLVSLLLAVLFFAWIVLQLRSPDAGVRSLMAGLTRWRVAPFYYAFALLILPLTWWAGAGLAQLVGASVGQPLVAGHPWQQWMPLFVINFVLIAIFTGGVCEEVGWRGYLQPVLQTQFSPLVASILVGIAWSFWHAPLHLIGFYPGGAVGIFTRLPVVILLAILFAWLYNRTGGSILLVILLHATTNSLVWIAPGNVFVIVPSLIVIIALVAVDRMHRRLPQLAGEPAPVPVRPSIA
jgi:uncharacterized protein